MSVLDDFLGTATNVLGSQSVVDLWKTYNTEKIRVGLAESENTINELKAGTERLRTQVELDKTTAATTSGFNFGNFDLKKIAPYALAAGGLYLAYRFLK